MVPRSARAAAVASTAHITVDHCFISARTVVSIDTTVVNRAGARVTVDHCFIRARTVINTADVTVDHCFIRAGTVVSTADVIVEPCFINARTVAVIRAAARVTVDPCFIRAGTAVVINATIARATMDPCTASARAAADAIDATVVICATRGDAGKLFQRESAAGCAAAAAPVTSVQVVGHRAGAHSCCRPNDPGRGYLRGLPRWAKGNSRGQNALASQYQPKRNAAGFDGRPCAR
jgi:hypothetical protein